jgi:hypothetical protein
MFTQVNFRCISRLGDVLNDHGIKWRCLFALQSVDHVNALKRKNFL